MRKEAEELMKNLEVALKYVTYHFDVIIEMVEKEKYKDVIKKEVFWEMASDYGIRSLENIQEEILPEICHDFERMFLFFTNIEHASDKYYYINGRYCEHITNETMNGFINVLIEYIKRTSE